MSHERLFTWQSGNSSRSLRLTSVLAESGADSHATSTRHLLSILSRQPPMKNFRFQPGNPPADVVRILDAIAVVYSGSCSPVSVVGTSARRVISSTWKNVCGWMSVIIRSCIRQEELSEASVPFCNKAVVALWLILNSTEDATLHSRPPVDSGRISAFEGVGDVISAAVHAAYVLADVQSPLFELLWTELERIHLQHEDALCEYARHAYLQHGIDLPHISIRLLVNELSKPLLDTSGLAATLKFLARSNSSCAKAHVSAVSRDEVRWLTLALRHLVSRWETIHPDDHWMACSCMYVVIAELYRTVELGYSFADDAVRGHILRSMAKAWVLQDSFTISKQFSFSGFFSTFVERLAPYLLFRSVAIAVLREGCRLRKSKEWNSLPMDNPFRASLNMLFDRSVVANYQWKKFMQSHAPSMLCSNPKCTTKHVEGDKIRLFRCTTCRVSVYCGKQCQRRHWRDDHRCRCSLYPHPTSGRTRHIPHLDELFLRFLTRQEVMVHRLRFPSPERNVNQRLPLYIFGADWQTLPPVFRILDFGYPILPREWSDPVVSSRVGKEYLSLKRGEIVVVIKYPGGLTADDMLIFREQLVNSNSEPDI